MANKSIVALYDDFADAQEAVRDLESSGIPRSDISLIASDAERRYGGALPDDTNPRSAQRGVPVGDVGSEAATGAGTGAVVGGVLGGGAGLLAGLGALAIPGIGPVIAAGPIVAMLAGAGIGAAAGGLIGALIGLGVPEEEAHGYAEGVRRGGTLVTVKVSDSQLDKAVAVLERHAPVDVDERGTLWRESGWSRFDETAEPYPSDRIAAERERYRSGHRRLPADDTAVREAGKMPSGTGSPGGSSRVRSYGASPARQTGAAENR